MGKSVDDGTLIEVAMRELRRPGPIYRPSISPGSSRSHLSSSDRVSFRDETESEGKEKDRSQVDPGIKGGGMDVHRS